MAPTTAAKPRDPAALPTVKEQLSSLVARQTQGFTNEPSALTVTAKTGAPAPVAGPAPAVKKKGKQESTRSKRRNEKAREKAAELSGKLETKVQQREGRKARRERAKKAWE